MSSIAHTMPFMILNEEDLKMAHTCLKSLSEGLDHGALIIFNQGYLSNEELRLFLDQYPIKSIIIGKGENEGIPIGRQRCFEYIWKNMPEIDYISEIHVDMLFTKDWAETMMAYLDNHDEPMMSPGILTGFGELHPEGRGIKGIEVPSNYNEILTLLHHHQKEEVSEGFVHPVIHKSSILKSIGGYDTRFLKGKQGYEDDSILLGYRYYMGLKNNWKPKSLLSTRVLHISLAQRMKLNHIQEETNTNLKGLIEQYGVYGLNQLAIIHSNNHFKCIADSIIQKNQKDHGHENRGHKNRILIASPVHQKHQILELFLASLKNVNKENFKVDYIFCDDNIDEESSALLNNFSDNESKVTLFRGKQESGYLCNDQSHYWKEDLVWKVAEYKERMIEVAKEEGYDYLFFIDSDLLLYPQTINSLIAAKKDIISNIFWTKWKPEQQIMPNVWLSGTYTMVDKRREEQLTQEELINRHQAFLQKLTKPGIYEVGGLGACTLISRRALLSGVSFQEINNLDYWGEDRHFCIRAKVLGYSLYVDTKCPAFHIYRESDVEGAKEFLKKVNGIDLLKGNKNKKEFTRYFKKDHNKLVLSMIIKDEAGRYLRNVLEHARTYIDEAVIIDDGSQDNSVAICEEILKGIPCYIIKNKVSKFRNEIELRRQQWEETIKRNPDWILNLDADEIFEDKILEVVNSLINQSKYDVYYFRLYDFWNQEYYREDQYWCAHKTYRPFLMRYQKDFPYEWKETSQHCGRFPMNICQLPHTTSSLRLKHYGWSQYEDRLDKYKRYMVLDPDGKYGWKEQYESILDENPSLVKWEES
jgi:GT2 family glycosyltransferase